MPKQAAVEVVAAAATLFALVGVGHPAAAQGGYEIEVYSSETVLPHFFMVELHSNEALQGLTITPNIPTTIFDRVASAQTTPFLEDPTCRSPGGPAFARADPAGAIAARSMADSIGCTPPLPTSTTHTVLETLEVAAGITDWWEVGGYLLGNQPPDSGLAFAGATVRSTMRVPHEWRWPIGLAFAVESEHDRAAFSPNTWTLEFRTIIDKAIGRWYVSLNPTLARTLRGAGTTLGLQFSPSATATFDVTRKVTAGVEYYGDWGAITNLAAPATRPQQLFGVVDLRLSPVWELNGGLGWGLTASSDALTAKVLVGRRVRY